ncbi:hypothetical protein HanPSC8_Chr08g0310281 [Helianthus annuus]|nr:hypothetical protein HanPSC8_Chr08g0310281 [Helianthus annuus]
MIKQVVNWKKGSVQFLAFFFPGYALFQLHRKFCKRIHGWGQTIDKVWFILQSLVLANATDDEQGTL